MSFRVARAVSVSTEENVSQPTNPKLMWVLAVASGLTVANLYYMQPVLASMSRSLKVSSGEIGFVSILGQIGYAFGLLLIVPLGDSRNRRNLITLMLLAVTLALVGVATAPNITWLGIANLAVGITTVIPQIIIPFAATIAQPHERGKVVGTVMSGLLIGILLARTFSGFINSLFGWQAIYWIAAIMMFGLAGVLRRLLPQDQPRSSLNYLQLLRSLWQLVRTEPVLREASVFGGLAFGAFNVFWVSLAFFLELSPYHFGSEVVGLFGLVGVAGALGAFFAGKLSDRMDARRTTGAALAITLFSFILFWLTGQWLWGLIIGVILLDLGTQVAHISNQTRVFSLHPESRSRLNTVYMVSYFVGGSLGSALGVFGWSLARWNGVCLVGGLLLVLALSVYLMVGRSLKTQPK